MSMNLLVGFILWCVVAVVATMRFRVSIKFSDTERARRVAQGDKEALTEVQHLDEQPLLTSMQYIVKTVLMVGLIIVLVLTLGVLNGLVLGVIALLLVPIAFRVSFICRMADWLQSKLMPVMRRAIPALRPVLVWLRDRDLVNGDTSLNSQDELLDLVKRSPGVLSSDELMRLEASLSFDNHLVKDVMTPRSMIEGVKANETLGPLVIDELYKTGHSRFPVYNNDLDHVVGVLYLHDLLDLKKGSKTAEKAMQSKVYYIREDKDLSHALHGFLTTHHHLFVVVNGYRETVGLLSLEDVIEVLIGKKIVDEFDSFDDLRAVATHNPKDNNVPKGKEDI